MKGLENLQWKDKFLTNFLMNDVYFPIIIHPYIFSQKTETMEDSRDCNLQLKFWNVVSGIFLCMELVPASKLTGDKVHYPHSGIMLRIIST